MKTYYGRRSPDGAADVWIVDDPLTVFDEKGLNEAAARNLNPRLDLHNHSPTGFEWGYGGSGPSQLALALLADALGDDETAQQLYQQFKWAVVCKLGASWTLSASHIREVVETLKHGEETAP